MTLTRRLVLCASLVAATSGCWRPTPIGWFDDRAFYPTRQHYRIRYLDGGVAERALLGPRWRVVNFTPDALGRPERARPRWDDLVGDPEDLRFESLDDDGFAWVRTEEIDAVTAVRPLSIVAESFVSGFAIHGSDARWMPGAPRLAPRVIEHGPARFGARVEAYRVRLEVLDADLAEQGAGASVYLVFARPEIGSSAEPGVDGRDGAQLVTFGLVSRPENAAAHAAELDAMLQRVDFR